MGGTSFTWIWYIGHLTKWLHNQLCFEQYVWTFYEWHYYRVGQQSGPVLKVCKYVLLLLFLYLLLSLSVIVITTVGIKVTPSLTVAGAHSAPDNNFCQPCDWWKRWKAITVTKCSVVCLKYDWCFGFYHLSIFFAEMQWNGAILKIAIHIHVSGHWLVLKCLSASSYGV